MSKGIIIAGFGGVGKTELAKKYENVIDLESIFWKWQYNEKYTNIEEYKSCKNKIPNPDFPQNYIEAIKENQKKYDIVLTAYNTIIYEALKENKVSFLLCYPEKTAKDIYIERYRKRGNNERFINKNIESFEREIDAIEKRIEAKIVLHGNETLEDYLIKNAYYLKKYKEENRMDILLTSNGFHDKSKRSKEIDKVFKKVAKDKRVVIILNATKEGSNVQNIDDVRKNFERVGTEIVDLLMIDRQNLEEIFNYDVIYAMGGDPRVLLDDFWDCNFKQYLIKFLEKGIYIGESASSMVLCDNLKYVWNIKKGTKPKYDIIPKTFEGLNLVKQRIYPHYNRVSEEQKQKIDKYEKEHDIKITRLNDGEFIWV